MFAYILKRLLWMIPTFFGILVINFAVLRLSGMSLTDHLTAESMQPGKEGDGGGRRTSGATNRNLQNYIDRFRRSGNDLPALINLRGFLTKDDLVAWLRRTEPSPDRRESERSDAEKTLWLCGRYAVLPLAEVLRDDALGDLHGPASLAFSLCAHTTVTRAMNDTLSSAQLTGLQRDNGLLTDQRIAYRSLERGFATDDPQAAAKRAALLAFIAQPEVKQRYDASMAGRWLATITETGFVDICGKMLSGTLESESRKDYAFKIINERWGISLGITFTSIVIAWLVSIPLGIRSARRQGTLEDAATTQSLFFLWSLPSMFVGTLLLHYLCTDSSTAKAWFPSSGLWTPGAEAWPWWQRLGDWSWHAVLPLICLTYGSFTELSRYMRGQLLDQLSSDYVRTARAKGCSEDRIVYGHALRNSLITMITLGSGLLAGLFGGSVIVETIFSIPGLGWLIFDASVQQDAPLVMASTVIFVGLLLFGILIADLCYGLADPRLRGKYD